MTPTASKLTRAIQITQLLRKINIGVAVIAALALAYSSIVSVVSVLQGGEWFTVAWTLVIGPVILAFAVAVPLALGFVIQGLEAQEYWAWVGAVAFFALCLGSVLFPFGVYGLAKLLDQDVASAFKPLSHTKTGTSRMDDAFDQETVWSA